MPGLAIFNNRAEKDFASIADHVYSGAFTSGGYPVKEILELRNAAFYQKKKEHISAYYIAGG